MLPDCLLLFSESEIARKNGFSVENEQIYQFGYKGMKKTTTKDYKRKIFRTFAPLLYKNILDEETFY